MSAGHYTSNMKAVLIDRCGPPDVLTVRDIERPVAGDSQVLIEVHAAAVPSPGVIFGTIPGQDCPGGPLFEHPIA